MIRTATVVVAALLAFASCSNSAAGRVVLDGRPRVPDVEGVATRITTTAITLDRRHSYPVDRKQFRSFSTVTLQLEPMLNREGQYVQLGVRHGQATWMAGIGAVLATQPATALYVGRLRLFQRDRMTFRDGTVLRVAKGVKVPPSLHALRATIDVERHRVSGIDDLG